MKTSTAILSLFTIFLTVSVSTIAVLVPVTDADCIKSTDDYIGEFNNTYRWNMPVYSDSSLFSTSVSAEFTMDISRSDYLGSMNSSVMRYSSRLVSGASEMITPHDKYIREIASYLDGLTQDCNDRQKANTVLHFVESTIHYCSDQDLYGTEERWAFPIETLYAHAGDCEDISALYVSIMMAMGYDAVLFQFETHVAAGVAIGAGSSFGFTDGETYYTYCECSCVNKTKDVGWMPLEYRYQTPEIVRAHQEPVGDLVAGISHMANRIGTLAVAASTPIDRFVLQIF